MDPPYPDIRRQTLHFRPVSSLLGISISEIAAGPQGTFAREAGTGAVYSFGYDILGRPEPEPRDAAAFWEDRMVPRLITFSDGEEQPLQEPPEWNGIHASYPESAEDSD